MTDPAPVVETLTVDRKSEQAIRIRKVSNMLIKLFRRNNVSHDDSLAAMCNIIVSALEMSKLTMGQKLHAIDGYARSMKQGVIANAEKRTGMM
jgi:hypothetical protein